jgi:TPR repeat protein
MPEVPQNMQNDLQRLEREASGGQRTGSIPNVHSANVAGFSSQYTSQQQQQSDEAYKALPAAPAVPSSSGLDMPSFSPFPKVTGDNIPPSDEEKGRILYQAREHVLHGNNVSMQLSWARDALMWVEVAAEARIRDAETRREQRPQEATKIESELRKDAMNIVKFLADQHHPEATFMKAKWLEFGKFDQPLDKDAAFRLYKESARLGWARADYRMGMLYENSIAPHERTLKDRRKLSQDTLEKERAATEHYNEGMKKKDSAAQYRMGMMYLLGQHGYPEDPNMGVQLIAMAADTADEESPQGAYVYGMLIARELSEIKDIGEDILPFDLGVARQYIEKAAYLSSANAQLKMGQAYELCQLGCDFNPKLSLHYYALAARQGQREAALGVSRWFLFGQEGSFSKNEQLAFQYAQQAADAGLATGEFALGYYYEIGLHVAKDLKEARVWYERAEKHGNKDAKGRIASLDASKTLTKKDHETVTLGRIKSQHGSMRGKRPERFAKANQVMPTVSEGENVAGTATPPRVSPRPSPRGSPARRPQSQVDSVDMPDARLSSMNGAGQNRQPAFALNVEQSLPSRPKSSAPYPEDDRPAPLNVQRPASAAPYPEDDHGPRHSSLQASYPPQGPHADRPGSAFGIRTLDPASAAQPQRGRVVSQYNTPSAGWEPQVPAAYRQPSPGPPSNYRQPSPGPARPVAPYDQPLTSRMSGPPGGLPSNAAPIGDPTRARLQKAPPSQPQQNLSSPPPQFPQGQYGPRTSSIPSQPQPQPGRDYGRGAPVRPVSANYEVYDRNNLPSQTGAGMLPSRIDSLPNSMGSPPTRPVKDTRQNQLVADARGRSSAPPLQQGYHQSHGSMGSIPSVNSGASISSMPGSMPGTMASAGGGRHSSRSPAPSVASTTQLPGHGGGRPAQGQVQGQGMGQGHGRVGSTGGGKVNTAAHPDGRTFGQGPATFEEMGIPQGKNEGDCVSLPACPQVVVNV